MVDGNYYSCIVQAVRRDDLFVDFLLFGGVIATSFSTSKESHVIFSHFGFSWVLVIRALASLPGGLDGIVVFDSKSYVIWTGLGFSFLSAMKFWVLPSSANVILENMLLKSRSTFSNQLVPIIGGILSILETKRGSCSVMPRC